MEQIDLNEIKINGHSLEGIDYYLKVKMMIYLDEFFNNNPDGLIDKQSLTEIKNFVLNEIKQELKIGV
jgi:hypothetical protein